MDKDKIDDAIVRLKTARKGVRLDGISWQDLRDEGRENDQCLAVEILKGMETFKYFGEDKKRLRETLYERKPEA